MKYSILLLILLLAACSATKKTVKDESAKSGRLTYDESFDPLTLNDDDIVITAENADKDHAKKIEKDTKLAIPVKETDGFRVQIVATKNIETASLVEQEATDQFNDTKQKIYLIFEAPLYKVRIGDFLSRDDAEQLQVRARTMGYREAFIVKTKVIPQAEEDLNIPPQQIH